MTGPSALSVLAVATLVLVACGGSDTPSSGETADDVVPDEPTDGTGGAPSSGESGTATLTIADGTVFEFEMSSCATSVNDPDSFLVDPGYDLFGTNGDGARFSLNRAAFEEPTLAIGDLEYGLDENGVNPSVYYTIGEPESVITLDGDTITGDLVLDGSLSSQQDFGEETTATLVVTC